MMRILFGTIGAALLALVMVATGAGQADDKPAERAAPPPPSEQWRNDPACQMVFFAVLEGLYVDGVPDEAVDLIVPPKTNLDTNVKHDFVFRCPLCHAAYEAFVLYQRRQAFNGANEKKSTFGKNFDARVIEQLKSDKPQVRVYAMGRLIRPWIDRKLNEMNLDETQKAAMVKKLLDYAAEGDRMFREYKQDPKSVYIEWQFYGGCQACEAAKTVAASMKSAPAQAPAQEATKQK